MLALGAVAFGLALRSTPARAAAAPYPTRGLIDQGGADQSLAEVADGQTLILVVMKGHYCSVCRAQLARLQALFARLKALRARVAGINADPYEANRAVSEKYGLAMPILSDRQHAVVGPLGLWLEQAGHPMPAVVVFDRCGQETWRVVGRDSDSRPEAALLELAERLHLAPPSCTVA